MRAAWDWKSQDLPTTANEPKAAKEGQLEFQEILEMHSINFLARTPASRGLGFLSPCPGGELPLAYCLLAVVAMTLTSSVNAALISTSSSSLTFNSGVQSLFGIGGSAGFHDSGFLIGDSDTGIEYHARLDTGTARSSVTGSVRSTYDNKVNLATAASYGFSLSWQGASSSFRSDVGAGIRFSGELLGVINDFTIFDGGYSLNIGRSFSGSVPQTVIGSDSFAPASVSISLPTGGIGVAGTAGVDFSIIQNATFRLTSVGGTVQAIHKDSGTRRVAPFSFAIGGPYGITDLDLSLAGIWDFNFLDLTLAAEFSSLFRMAVNPFIGGGIGVFCGDPFNPDDNFLCIEEGGVTTNNAIGVNLFSTPTLNMGGSRINSLAGFSVEVVDPFVSTPPATVPEPGTIVLTISGFAALCTMLSRRNSRRANG